MTAYYVFERKVRKWSWPAWSYVDSWERSGDVFTTEEEAVRAASGKGLHQTYRIIKIANLKDRRA